jgi:hypothetical protein
MLRLIGQQAIITFIFCVLLLSQRDVVEGPALAGIESASSRSGGASPYLPALPPLALVCDVAPINQSFQSITKSVAIGIKTENARRQKRRDSKDGPRDFGCYRHTGIPVGNTCFSAAMPKISWSTFLVPFWSSASFRRTALTPGANPGNRYRPMICRVC